MKSLYVCETCGKEVYEKFGSGRFCSRSCANKRKHSLETKLKISESICNKQHKKFDENEVSRRHQNKAISTFECEFCGKAFPTFLRLKYHVTQSHKNEDISKYRKVKVTCKDKVVEINYTKDQLEAYRKVHTACEICGKTIDEIRAEPNHFKNLSVDHNHSTLQFRGLLCNNCNTNLGWLEIHMDNIFNYLNSRGSQDNRILESHKKNQI